MLMRVRGMPVPVAFLVAVVLMAAVACELAGSSPGDTPEPTAAAGLDGTRWTVVSIGGSATVERARPTLEFSGNQVGGSTGCNRLTGTYTLDGTSLVFQPLATTRRACEGVVMAQETALLQALASVTGWSIGADGRLVLTGGTEVVLEPDLP